MRPNWSLMRDFKGQIYSAPTLEGGFSQSSERMGKKAASVLPLAVEEVSRRWFPVRNSVRAAATCTPRRESQRRA